MVKATAFHRTIPARQQPAVPGQKTGDTHKPTQKDLIFAPTHFKKKKKIASAVCTLPCSHLFN
jgi:hypothetical protein